MKQEKNTRLINHFNPLKCRHCVYFQSYCFLDSDLLQAIESHSLLIALGLISNQKNNKIKIGTTIKAISNIFFNSTNYIKITRAFDRLVEKQSSVF
jgi:hypothetical protein